MDTTSPLFTDLYQLTMAEAYFRAGKHEAQATFELFFRRCPFHGEYAVLAGFDLIEEILKNFQFTERDLNYLRSLEPFKNANPKFFSYLADLTLDDIEIRAAPEGSLVFARVPLIQVKGPILKVQLLESALLNAVNFSSLVATYARRIREVSGTRMLVEFGLRRAQGPNGAMTATRASYLGGFDATSNVLAGQILGIPVVGTMAHSFVQSFWDVQASDLIWNGHDLSPLLEKFSREDGRETNRGELGAFLAYAKTFPNNALLLVDTYDTLKSGVPNAIRIFKLLREQGATPLGIRLDSGDLVYLSKEARKLLDAAGFANAKIFASNELDENVIESIQDQGAAIDAYGVGTQLVTAASQPFLGGVYKLVELDGRPRMKISQQTEKLVLPSAKNVYRLKGEDGKCLIDLMTLPSEAAPKPHESTLALHPSDPFRRAIVSAASVESLLQPLFQKGKWLDSLSLSQKRDISLEAMKTLRDDIKRTKNPAPYKVSVSVRLRHLTDDLYNQENPPTHLK